MENINLFTGKIESFNNKKLLRSPLVKPYRENKETSDNEITEYINYKFKTSDVKDDFNFTEEKELSLKFHSLNWYIEKYNNLVQFHCLKARDLDTNETVTFMFRKYNYMIYTLKDIEKNHYLSYLYNVSKEKKNNPLNFICSDIFSIDIKNAEKRSIQHFESFQNLKDYITRKDENLLSDKECEDFVILYTNFYQEKIINEVVLSSCENRFDKNFFFVMNKIDSAGVYEINNIKVKYSKSNIDDKIYFIEDNLIEEFFKNIYIVKSRPITNFLSFDIESEVRKDRVITSEKNIITHIGLEYLTTAFYDKKHENINNEQSIKINLKNTNRCFNFCLLNLDHYLLTSLENPKNKILTDYYKNKNKNRYNIIENENDDEQIENSQNEIYKLKDDLYDYLLSIDNYDSKSSYNKDYDLINKWIRQVIKKTFDPEITNRMIIYNFEEKDTNDILLKIINSEAVYIYLKEKEMLRFFVSIINTVNIDQVLSYNGNNYDFPQIGRRLSFFSDNNSKIIDTIKFKSLINSKYNAYGRVENDKTQFSVYNMDFHGPWFSVDMFVMVKKFYQGLPSYSLKDVALHFFNHNAYIINTGEDIEIRLLYGEENTLKFYRVLLSANYCFINNEPYKIIKKSGIEDDKNRLYTTDLENIISDTIQFHGTDFKTISNYFTIQTLDGKDIKLKLPGKYNICLSKDEVDIGSSEVYRKGKDEKSCNFKFNNKSQKLCYEDSVYEDVAKYCIHDSILCRYLYDITVMGETINSMSHYFYLSPRESIMYRNEQNLKGPILKTYLEEGIFLLTSKKHNLDKISGGLVLEPKEKFILEPVSIFDFESLYPSIMLSKNIMPDCLILVITLDSHYEILMLRPSIEQRFNSKEYTVVYNSNQEENIFNIMVFAKNYKNGLKKISLIGHILTFFKKERKFFKSEMKRFKGLGKEYDFLYEKANLMQLVIKILMNSVYGLTATSFAVFSCSYTAQSITLIGRYSITFLKNYFSGAVIKNNKLIINSKIDENNDFDFDNKNIYNPITCELLPRKKIYDIDFDSDFEIVLDVIYGDTDSVMVMFKNINEFPLIIDNNYKEYLDNLLNIEDKKIRNDKIGKLCRKDNSLSDEIEYLEKCYNIHKNKIIYLSSFIGNQINDVINKNLLKGVLNMEFENIALDYILIAKKKYKSKKIAPLNLKDFKLSFLQTPEIEKINLKLKDDHKGISIKRRDNSNFQKKNVILFYNFIDSLCHKFIFKKRIEIDLILEYIYRFLEQTKYNLINDFKKNKLNIEDFAITCSYSDNYKNQDYYLKKMVDEYNKTAKEQIMKGNRFKYIFMKEIKEEFKAFKSLDMSKEIIEKDCRSFIAALVNWEYIKSSVKINNFKIIYNETEKLNLDTENKQLYLEMYIYRLKKDLLTIFKKSVDVNNDLDYEDVNLLKNPDEKEYKKIENDLKRKEVKEQEIIDSKKRLILKNQF